MNEDPEFKIVTSYTLEAYPCGARAGDRVKLKQDLHVRDSDGVVVSTYQAGEIWGVLNGVRDEPEVVWLMKPNGKRHTWDDSDFWEWFENLSEEGTV